MPTIGASAIADIIGAKTFDVDGETVQFNASGDTAQGVGAAINAGWTCAAPVVPSTMAVAFAAQFANIVGQGLAFLMAIANGIDAEIALWVASYVPPPGPGTHAYVVSAAGIVSLIQASSPLWSAGAQALAEAAADAFMSGFQQEVG